MVLMPASGVPVATGERWAQEATRMYATVVMIGGTNQTRKRTGVAR